MDEKEALQLYKVVTAMSSRILRQEARIDTLHSLVILLLKRTGTPYEKAVKAVNEMVESRHQFLLEAAENLNPALGAALDTRPPIPELPDDAL
jgi:hypothetical protein